MSRCSWQYSLIVSTFCVVSGGVISHIAFGLPPRVLNNDFALPCTVVSWYLMNYFPKDLVFYLYHNFVPFRVVSEALHRVHQVRSLNTGIGLGRVHGTPLVGALMGGLVSATTSSFAREYLSGGTSPLQKPGYTFTALSWAVVFFVLNAFGKYTFLVEIYFGLVGQVIPNPFPLNIFGGIFTKVLSLQNPNRSLSVKDKTK